MRSGTWVAPAGEVAEPNGLTVTQAFARYHESEEWYAKAENTTRKVELHKMKPVVAAMGSRLIAELTEIDVETYMSQRRRATSNHAKAKDGKLSNTQIRLEVAALSSMLNWAADNARKHVVKNVAKHVKRPVNARRTERVPDAVMGAILEKAPIFDDPVAYAFFRTLFTTGCRPGEIAGAPRSWLRADPPQISLPTSKNNDARTIVLPQNLYNLIAEVQSEQPGCPLIFGTKKRFEEGWGPYNYAVPWAKALSLAVAAGQAPSDFQLVPYHARHELLSKLFERTTLSDGAIAAVGGQRSQQALWHYRHLRNEHNRKLMERMDDLVGDAIDRAISPSHPSKPLAVGELLTDKKPRKQASPKRVSPYITKEQYQALLKKFPHLGE
jgi:integrase